MEGFERDTAEVREFLENIPRIVMSGHAPKQDCTLLPQGCRDEHEVFVGQWAQRQPLYGVSQVLVCLVGRPSAAVHPTSFGGILSITMPCKPQLLLPLEVIDMRDLLGLQLEHDIAHVREELDDRLHHRPLGLRVLDRREVRPLIGGSSPRDTGQALANLVDPELQAKVEAAERLFLQDAHGTLPGIPGGDVLGPQVGVGIGLIVDIEVVAEHVPPEVDPI